MYSCNLNVSCFPCIITAGIFSKHLKHQTFVFNIFAPRSKENRSCRRIGVFSLCNNVKYTKRSLNITTTFLFLSSLVGGNVTIKFCHRSPTSILTTYRAWKLLIGRKMSYSCLENVSRMCYVNNIDGRSIAMNV